ncbi:MAG: DUF882 domain-containing protein [Labilithrix sp.]
MKVRTLAIIALVFTTSSVAFGDPPKPASKGTTAMVKKPAPPPSPVAASRGWHQAPPGATAPKDSSGRVQLVLQGLNHTDRAVLTAHSEKGGFSAEDLDKAAHILRDTRTGNEHPVDPRTLDLLYRVAAHFNTPEVRIISGYRTPRPGSHSNHGNGRAIDCVFAGTSDEEVAKFAREEGFSGVGTYPVSGFVHLDVRDRSYFWVDYSGPGKKNRTRGILGDLAAKSDARAAARGEHGCSPFGISTDVDGALAAATHPNAPGSAPEEDDEDESSP